jgi:AGZA family xanthine/uracil permease-like MFS transporter
MAVTFVTAWIAPQIVLIPMIPEASEDASTEYPADPEDRAPESEETSNLVDETISETADSSPNEPPSGVTGEQSLSPFAAVEKQISLAIISWFKNSLMPPRDGQPTQGGDSSESSDEDATAQPSENPGIPEEISEPVVEAAEASQSVSEASAEITDIDGESTLDLDESDEAGAEATAPETEPPSETTPEAIGPADEQGEVATPEIDLATEPEVSEIEATEDDGADQPEAEAAVTELANQLGSEAEPLVETPAALPSTPDETAGEGEALPELPHAVVDHPAEDIATLGDRPAPIPRPGAAVAREPAVVVAIARFFDFEALGTNLRTEILAGITTFITMAYILVVNPDILSQAIFVTESGDLFGQLVVATGISAAIATLIMGLVAKYPIALAPGMGLNAFFAFSVVIGLGIDWRVALAAILVEGLIFIALTLTNLRAHIIKAIPESLKRATAAGIGLFIAYIALAGNPEFGGAGIIIASDATKTALGDLSQPPTLMALFGILVSSALLARRVQGALLWGILATASLGWILGITPWPEGIVGLPFWPGHLLGQAFVGLGQISTVGVANFLVVLFVFLFVDLFDTIGTLSGIGMQAGFINKSGELPRANRALFADAIGTTAGAVLGTSTVTSYIESASGIAEGGRSGFTAVVTAICFLLSLFFIPLLAAIPGYATAPALLMVGVMMMGSVAAIRWSDPAESIPCFLTILLMPLTFSIAEGLAVGFIAYPLIKAAQGKAQEVNGVMWVLAIVFLARFVLMGLGIA